MNEKQEKTYMDSFEVFKCGNGYFLKKNFLSRGGYPISWKDAFVFNTLDQMFDWIREQYNEAKKPLYCNRVNPENNRLCKSPHGHAGCCWSIEE